MAQAVCSVVDCDRYVHGHALCHKHYMRWRKHGDPLWVRPFHGECVIEGCSNSPRSRTAIWCELHYGRWRRNGHPERLRSVPDRSYHSQGYVMVHAPDHPLARRNRVFEHRMVLYEEIGPESTSCFWCGATVHWCREPKINVDHLDGSRRNNRPENLVPSCKGCNVGRGGHRDPIRNAVFLAARRVLEQHRGEFVAEVAEIQSWLGEGDTTAQAVSRAKASAARVVWETE